MSTTGAPVMPATTAATCDSLYCSRSDACRTCSAERCRCFESSSFKPVREDARHLSGQLLAHRVMHCLHSKTLHALRRHVLKQGVVPCLHADCVLSLLYCR